MAAVATTLRSLLLTATGSITVLGTVLVISATPASRPDAPAATASSPAEGSGTGQGHVPWETFRLPTTPRAPDLPKAPEGGEPHGAPVMPEAPILPGAAALPERPARAPVRPGYPPYGPVARPPRWEHYLGRTPSSSSTATTMKPTMMIIQIHPVRLRNPSSLISVLEV